MSEVMQQLHQDHVRVARLMRWLEGQLDRFEAGERPDYERMCDTMHYLTHYTDLFHHPREDFIFEKLAAKEPALAEAVARLRDEHIELARLGERFYHTLENICEDIILPRERVEAEGRAYIDTLYRHFNVEEGEIFPRALALLDGRHWAAVDRHLGFREDPLFGPEVEVQYAALYERISDGGSTAPHA